MLHLYTRGKHPSQETQALSARRFQNLSQFLDCLLSIDASHLQESNDATEANDFDMILNMVGVAGRAWHFNNGCFATVDKGLHGVHLLNNFPLVIRLQNALTPDAHVRSSSCY
jgi:hypothetical protein